MTDGIPLPVLDGDRLPALDGDRLRALVGVRTAIAAVEQALLDGSAPGDTPPRGVVPTGAGDLLLMPAVGARFVGVKVVTVAPANPAAGLPRVQGVYLLFDGRTLAPVARLDGVALTTLRTCAVSAVAVHRLAPAGPVRLVVIGTGPQAYGHVEAMAAVRPVRHVTVAGRDRDRAEALGRWCAGRVPAVDVLSGPELAGGLERPVRAADVVVCATSSATPVIRSSWVRDDATVIAIGSHSPDAREVDSELVLRASVVVETRGSALREAGDLIIPIREGAADPDRLITAELAELVRGTVRPPADRPRLFKSVGEAWQDLVIAARAYDALTADRGTPR